MYVSSFSNVWKNIKVFQWAQNISKLQKDYDKPLVIYKNIQNSRSYTRKEGKKVILINNATRKINYPITTEKEFFFRQQLTFHDKCQTRSKYAFHSLTFVTSLMTSDDLLSKRKLTQKIPINTSTLMTTDDQKENMVYLQHKDLYVYIGRHIRGNRTW